MRFYKWIVAGLLGVGLVFTGVHSAQAYTAADLYGTWTGTYTYSTTPPPELLTTSGIELYTPPSGFFDAEPINFTFATSTQFAFSFEFAGSTVSGEEVFLPVTQTGASISGDTFTVDENVFVPLTEGSQSKVGTHVFSGTIQIDPANSQELLMTGTWDTTATVSSLPSDATEDWVTNSVRDFSLTKAIPSGPSTVPLPPAAWSVLAMLGGLAVLQAVRSRRRLGLNV
jgi:hypothetical protein